jgi:hypothetical protein
MRGARNLIRSNPMQLDIERREPVLRVDQIAFSPHAAVRTDIGKPDLADAVALTVGGLDVYGDEFMHDQLLES